MFYKFLDRQRNDKPVKCSFKIQYSWHLYCHSNWSTGQVHSSIAFHWEGLGTMQNNMVALMTIHDGSLECRSVNHQSQKSFGFDKLTETVSWRHFIKWCLSEAVVRDILQWQQQLLSLHHTEGQRLVLSLSLHVNTFLHFRLCVCDVRYLGSQAFDGLLLFCSAVAGSASSGALVGRAISCLFAGCFFLPVTAWTKLKNGQNWKGTKWLQVCVRAWRVKNEVDKAKAKTRTAAANC